MDLRRILDETFVASAEYHDVLDSTNNRARLCIAEACPLPRLIVADHQTAGRGRGANRWWTGQGSLAMSLVLPADIIADDPGRSALISLAAGVAVVETIDELLTQNRSGQYSSESDCQGEVRPAEVGLHWPNDVMLGGRKLVGILVEALAQRYYVVGIGINTNNTAADAPDELRERVVTLHDVTGQTYDHVALLTDMMKRLEMWLGKIRHSAEDVSRRADELCLQRGRMLTIQMGEERIAGRCQGIGADGALLIETPDGIRACHSGVVE